MYPPPISHAKIHAYLQLVNSRLAGDTKLARGHDAETIGRSNDRALVEMHALPVERAAGLVPDYQEVTFIVLMDGTVVKPVVSDKGQADKEPTKKSQD